MRGHRDAAATAPRADTVHHCSGARGLPPVAPGAIGQAPPCSVSCACALLRAAHTLR